MKPEQAAATHAVFPTTCWTAVLSLKNAGSERARNIAMAALCETYWFPLYAFARHRGKSKHDAEDAVQSFFLSIADSDYFQKADHDKGKMRTFLLTGFTRHMKDIHVHDTAQKRGGGSPTMSIDTDQAEEWLLVDEKASSNDASLTFEKNWAQATIRAALNLLSQESGKNDRAVARFQVLSRFLHPAGCANYTQQEAAEELGMSVAACEKAIQRLRQRFRATVREQVASTLEDPTDENVTEEMTQLQKALVSLA